MSKLLRNKSLTNRPNNAKLIELNEILLISDKNEKQKSLNQLITHLLLNNCVLNKCHDLSLIFTDLTTNLIHFQSCDQPIDRLLAEFNLIDVNDEQIETKYLQLICESINLKPFKCIQILENIINTQFTGFKRFSDEKRIQSKELKFFDKMHSFLSQLKIAKFETNLLRTIDKRFPYISGPMTTVHSHDCYVYNVLKAYDYVSNKQKLMAITFAKLLEIDALIASNKNKISEEVFNIDDCNPIAKQMEILDNCMDLLFNFINEKTKNRTAEETQEFFEIFKTLFSKVLLTPEPSNHLQYVWLYLCSVSNQFFDQFIQYLWNLGLNTEYPIESREKALYFISSLLKNATFVSINEIIAFMNMSSLWIHKYIDENDRMADQLTTEDTIFYILCQILFDIFCSIHSELDNRSEQILRRVKSMNFQRIIKCKLNPLAFCYRDIETKFLRLARHYQIGYCIRNTDSNEERLKYPLDPLNNRSYVLHNSIDKIEKLCKYCINCETSLITEIEKFNRFNTSDESDHMMGSYKSSYSPSRNLWHNLLSDSSPNDHMDCD